MTYAVRPMSTPLTMREIAPHWMAQSPGHEELTGSLETLCERFGGTGVVLFRIRVGETPAKSTIIVSSGIEDQLRDAVGERATAAIVRKERNEVLPQMLPAPRELPQAGSLLERSPSSQKMWPLVESPRA